MTKWECVTCLQEKFPYVLVNKEEIEWMSFNSNLTCLCSHTNPSDLNLILNSLSNDDSANIDDPYDEIDMTKSKFKYYDMHDFHKLINNKKKIQIVFQSSTQIYVH